VLENIFYILNPCYVFTLHDIVLDKVTDYGMEDLS
jgi:hypothetical protein